MTKKIAIIGTAPASVGLAPYADPTWEIWACSPGNRGALPRITIWFELHAIREMMAPENRPMAEPYFDWLNTMSKQDRFQVVMQEFNSYVPKAIPYPLHEMLVKFGHNWFSSSIAFMMALAIERGATDIGLWGVDMAAEQEHYTGQRAGCTRFMEIARDRGVTVHIPMESCLAEPPPLYGYNEATPMQRRINAMMGLATGQRAGMAAEIERKRLEVAYFDGAMEQLRYFARTWVDGSEAALDFGQLSDKAKQYADQLTASGGIDRNAKVAPLPETIPIAGAPILPQKTAEAVKIIRPEAIPEGTKAASPEAFVGAAVLTGTSAADPAKVNGTGGHQGEWGLSDRPPAQPEGARIDGA